jgi:hypothetical protein
MAMQQPTQRVDNPQKQKRRIRLPRWLRIVAFVLALMFLISAAIFWIGKIWGGDLSNTLSAIFTALGAILALISLAPFFFSSAALPQARDSNHDNSPPQASPRPSVAEEARKQGPSPSTSSEQSNAIPLDRGELRTRLSDLPPTLFNAVVFNLRIASGDLLSTNTPQGQRAMELIVWAEHADGPGLLAVYHSYLEAVGKSSTDEKKKL